MNKILSFIKAATILAVFITLVSCSKHNSQKEPDNPNARFYNTEWSNKDYTEGVKFYNDDSCLSFAANVRARGTFSYREYLEPINDFVGCITFYGLEENFPNYTCVIDCAFIHQDGSMKLCWRYLGGEQGYYVMLYRRR